MDQLNPWESIVNHWVNRGSTEINCGLTGSTGSKAFNLGSTVDQLDQEGSPEDQLV